MKRHDSIARGVILLASFALLAPLALASCDADPIFASIEKEVALKDPSIRGIITSMVFTGDASGTKYTTNGRVYEKTGYNGDWDEISIPKHRCAQLAWDGTYLYGLMQDEDYAYAGIYYRSGSSWTKVSGTSDMVLMYSGDGFVYGFTHSGDEDGGTYSMYNLDDTGLLTAAVTGLAKPTGSAVNLGSASWFSTLGGVYTSAGNEENGSSTMPSGILAMTATSGGVLYAASSSKLWQFDGTDWTSITHKGTQTGVGSISWLPLTVSTGVVLVSGGDTEGYSEVTVTGVDSTPALSTVHWPGSGTSSLPYSDVAQYDSSVGQWTVNGIYADTSANSTGSNDYVLYACVVNDHGYDGLWSYYPDTRSEWNRE